MSSFYSSKHDRCPIDCNVEFCLDLFSQDTFNGFIENISESGMCLITTKLLDIGQELTINTNIFLPSHTATICWIEQNDDGSYKFGLKFK
jgi:hypothetical protein